MNTHMSSILPILSDSLCRKQIVVHISSPFRKHSSLVEFTQPTLLQFNRLESADRMQICSTATKSTN